MACYTDENGILNYYPENTEELLYIKCNNGIYLNYIIDEAKKHFNKQHIEVSDLQIEIEEFKSRCIGYDLYDGADWDNYLVISLI